MAFQRGPTSSLPDNLYAHSVKLHAGLIHSDQILVALAAVRGNLVGAPGFPANAITMDIRNLSEVPAFKTKDGSEIRELLAYRNSVIRQQSLAEARIPVGGSTLEHYHPKTEEIYYITHGAGRMRIEGELHDVKPGDAIAIPPGLKHKIWNTSTEVLRLLCCCAPCYEDSDTVMTEK